MTRETIEQLVVQWMRILRLHAWEVSVVWPEDYEKWPEHRDGMPDFSSDHTYAWVWRARDYTRARLYFNPERLSDDARTVEATIVHELLHLVTRDVEFILDQLDGLLHRDLDNLIMEAHNHAVEGAIDHIAYVLVDLRRAINSSQPEVVSFQ